MVIKRKAVLSILIVGIAIWFNESYVYHLVLSKCNWPMKFDGILAIRAMLLTDVHLIGPIKGYRFERMRIEAQMKRVYQKALELHQPDIVFILGDLFDEGEYVDEKYFNVYLSRFNDIFKTPAYIKRYSLVGNHDIGFHLNLHEDTFDLYKNAFAESDNMMFTIKRTHFVLLNSVTLYGDGCNFCAKTDADIEQMSLRLNCAKHSSNTSICRNLKNKLPFYNRPILIQHYPTYRPNDSVCIEHDYPELEKFEESRECLSKNATEFVGKSLHPAVAFCGHSHHYCRSINMWGGEEFTIASFNWQHKWSPSFLLAEFSGANYAVSKCDMPQQSTVVTVYVLCALAVVLIASYSQLKTYLRKKYHSFNARNYSSRSDENHHTILL